MALKPRANGLDGWDGLDASAAAGDEDEDLSRAIAASLAQENGGCRGNCPFYIQSTCCMLS